MADIRRKAVALLAAGLCALPAICLADGTVGAYRIDPHGRVSGVVMNDGTEVTTSPAQGVALQRAVHPGDGLRFAVGPGNTTELIDTRTSRFLDLGPRDTVARGGGPLAVRAVPYPRVDDARALETYAVESRVALVMHTPAGTPSGFLLADGTQVHLVPGVEGMMASVRTGQVLRVEGRGTRTPNGIGLWAMSIARPSGLVLLDMTRGVGARELGFAPTSGALSLR